MITARDHDPLGNLQLYEKLFSHVWRNRFECPMVFCHIEGAEKVLSVTTADGNEQSRSNDAEREEAVSNSPSYLISENNIPILITNTTPFIVHFFVERQTKQP